MCGRYVVTNAVTKTKNIVKTAINVQDSDNSVSYTHLRAHETS